MTIQDLHALPGQSVGNTEDQAAGYAGQGRPHDAGSPAADLYEHGSQQRNDASRRPVRDRAERLSWRPHRPGRRERGDARGQQDRTHDLGPPQRLAGQRNRQHEGEDEAGREQRLGH